VELARHTRHTLALFCTLGTRLNSATDARTMMSPNRSQVTPLNLIICTYRPRGAVAGELSANAAHGVPRTTNEDKRRAVLTLLNGKRPPTEVALAFHMLCMFG
jgi:hypothetical protein